MLIAFHEALPRRRSRTLAVQIGFAGRQPQVQLPIVSTGRSVCRRARDERTIDAAQSAAGSPVDAFRHPLARSDSCARQQRRTCEGCRHVATRLSGAPAAGDAARTAAPGAIPYCDAASPLDPRACAALRAAPRARRPEACAIGAGAGRLRRSHGWARAGGGTGERQNGRTGRAVLGTDSVLGPRGFRRA